MLNLMQHMATAIRHGSSEPIDLCAVGFCRNSSGSPTHAGLHLLSGDIVTAVQFNAGLVAFIVAIGVVLLQQQRVGTRGFVASIDADNT